MKNNHFHREPSPPSTGKAFLSAECLLSIAHKLGLGRHSVLVAIFLLLSITAFSGPVTLLGHWRLGEGQGQAMQDHGLWQAEGTLLNPDNTSWIPGRLGGHALQFEAHTLRQAGTVAITPDKNFVPQQGFSLSCWINISPASQRGQSYDIISWSDTDGGPGFRLFYAWETLVFRLGEGKRFTTIRSVNSQHPIKKGTWNQVTATFDGKQAKLYINGQLVAVSAPEKTIQMAPATERYFCIGSYRAGFAYGFLGAISEVKLYNRALTDREVMLAAKSLQLSQ